MKVHFSLTSNIKVGVKPLPCLFTRLNSMQTISEAHHYSQCYSKLNQKPNMEHNSM